MTKGSLYRWPATARFGRVVPKTKFYEYATISATVRGRFVTDVQRVIWAYKLADETIHLRGTPDVPEIQVFAIDAKDADVSDDLLTVIDKAIPFPIIFEINQGTEDQRRTRMAAAYKQLGGATPQLSDYFSTTWHEINATRVPLPPALDLPSLYAGLLAPILPIPVRPGEGILEATDRLDKTRKLHREITKLERKLHNEPQFNRKVEIRRQLRDRAAELAKLTDPATPQIPATPKPKDAPWTS